MALLPADFRKACKVLVETDSTAAKGGVNPDWRPSTASNASIYKYFSYILCTVVPTLTGQHHSTCPAPEKAGAGSYQGSYLTNPPGFPCREGAGVEPGPMHGLGLGTETWPRSGGTAASRHSKGEDVHFWSQGAHMYSSLRSSTSEDTSTTVQLLAVLAL